MSLSMALLFTTNATAFESVNGKALIGQTYGGVHYSYFSVDEDRLAIDGIENSYLNDGDGLGLELGYRLSEFNELRIQYTDMSIDAGNSNFGDKDGSLFGIDVLHFLQHQNLYVLGGFKEIDLDEEELTMNIGAGFRHHFNERFAAYVEAKGHYQFDEGERDFSASLGLIYYFGTNSAKPVAKSAPAKVTPVKQEVSPVVKDSDGDGVIDSEDQCAQTPMSDKVDENGCTMFTEETSTMELKINFDNNKTEIKTDYLSEVERAVNFLETYKHVNLTIEGHTSAQGNAKYNKELSMKRATAVVDMLVNQYGINASRLTAVGYGEEQLLNLENNAQAHADNRRIKAKVSVVNKVAVKK